MSEAAVVKIEPQASAVAAPQSESSALISMIERAARDPSVDIDKMERLFLMKERMDATAAKAAYLAALADMQTKLPVIDKKGMIDRGTHKTTGAAQKGSPYAKFEDVIEAVNPVLAAHGFSLSFRIDMSEPGRLKTTAVLGHRGGHSEETSISLPIDDSGGKNNVQGWGSSASYGKRYTAFALLNIVARGEDDDGKAAGATTTITEDQVIELRDIILAVGADEKRFCALGGVERLADIPASQFEAAKAKLAAKGARK